MEGLMARCGFRCSECLAYRATQEGDDELRKRVSDAWHEVFGFRIPPEKVVCNGCKPGSVTLDAGCKVKTCAEGRGFATCADCPEMGELPGAPCEKLKERLVDRARMEKDRGRPLSDELYEAAVRPYENIAALCGLRAGKP